MLCQSDGSWIRMTPEELFHLNVTQKVRTFVFGSFGRSIVVNMLFKNTSCIIGRPVYCSLVKNMQMLGEQQSSVFGLL